MLEGARVRCMKSYSADEIKLTINGREVGGIKHLGTEHVINERALAKLSGEFTAETTITMTKKEYKKLLLALSPRTKLRKRSFVSLLALTRSWNVW